jgi:hypothetical protein
LTAVVRLDDGDTKQALLVSAMGEEKMPNGIGNPLLQVSTIDEKGVRTAPGPLDPQFVVPGLNAGIANIDCVQIGKTARCFVITSSNVSVLVDVELVKGASSNVPVVTNTIYFN